MVFFRKVKSGFGLSIVTLVAMGIHSSCAQAAKRVHNDLTIYFAVSNEMPLSVPAMDEVGRAAEKLGIEVKFVTVRGAPMNFMRSGKNPTYLELTRRNPEFSLLGLHQPSLLIEANGKLDPKSFLPGYHSAATYLAHLSEYPKMNAFNYSIADQEMRPNYVPTKFRRGGVKIFGSRHPGFYKMFPFSNLGISPDYIFSFHGPIWNYELIQLGGPFENRSDPMIPNSARFVGANHWASGAKLFTLSGVLRIGAPKVAPFYTDPTFKTYGSVGTINETTVQGVYRFLRARTSSYDLDVLEIRDLEIDYVSDHLKPKVRELTEWIPVCKEKGFLALPILSRDGKMLGAFDGVSTKIYRIESDFSCTLVADLLSKTGKIAFNYDQSAIAFVTEPLGDKRVMTVQVYDLLQKTFEVLEEGPAYYKFGFPDFISNNELTVPKDISEDVGVVQFYSKESKPDGTLDGMF